MEKQTLNVRFMGSFRCECNGTPISFMNNISSKTAQLMLLLMYNAETGVSKGNALNVLYYNSESDANNSFKILLLRLRKQLAAEIGVVEDECITLRGGMLKLGDCIEVISDAADFRNNYNMALAEPNQAVAMQYMAKSVESYYGELLPQLSTEPWIIFENAALRDTYTRAVNALGAYYTEIGDLEKAHNCYKRALIFYPFEEEWMIGSIDSLISQGKNKQAAIEYEEQTSLLFDELGVYPSEQLMKTMHRMSDNMVAIRASSDIVSESLRDDSTMGAYYCTYPGFEDNYKILKRIMERDDVPATLVLLTLVNDRGQILENKNEVVSAMSVLRTALTYTLRRSDVFTRFSKAQMLVMLWNMPEENLDIVLSRLKEWIKRELPGENCSIKANVIHDEPPKPDNYDAGAERKKQWHSYT